MASQKYSVYYLLTPEAQIFGPFRSTIVAISEIQHVQGTSPNIRNALNDPKLQTWTLDSQMYSIYTKYFPLKPKFWSFRSMINHFWDTTCTRSAKIGNAPKYPKLNMNT